MAYGFRNIQSYMGEKQISGKELYSFSIMIIFASLLIYGGVIILNNEEIFRKLYEGFQVSDSASSSPQLKSTATQIESSHQLKSRAPQMESSFDLPEGLSLLKLQKNANVLRNKSSSNVMFAIGMIGIGSVIILYQFYNLFF